ncbi:uncharacterized protein LOC125484453 isoform X1 [Rhincodon typus]|uniref:uncharacterized protein LOC125484453 isoform X1 n=1 Tax=Rhincodon typus TaxID=259920 RepID=UPI00202F041D|nr:uncharacterized protein LOC125484453 isoform X1 [Rhincodon typus]
MLPRRVTKCLQSNTPARVFPFNYYSYLDIARLQCYWVWICKTWTIFKIMLFSSKQHSYHTSVRHEQFPARQGSTFIPLAFNDITITDETINILGVNIDQKLN